MAYEEDQYSYPEYEDPGFGSEPLDSGADDDWLQSTSVDLAAEYGPRPPRRSRSVPWGWLFLAFAVALGLIAGLVLLLDVPQKLAGRPGEAESSPVASETLPLAGTEPAVSTQAVSPSGQPSPSAALASAQATAELPPASSEVTVATYDAEGNLLSVADAQGQPLAEAAPASEFPAQLGRGQAAVAPQALAQPLGEMTTLDGASYDEASGQIVFVGHEEPGAPPLTPDDLLVALRSVYAGEDPGVSIDPGPTRSEMVVRYIGPTEDTHFGQVMFEADRLLKTLSLGQDNLSGAPVTSTVPGFQTEMDLIVGLSEFGSVEEPVWHRFWYVPEEVRLGQSQDRRTVSLEEVRLQVNTEYLGHDFQPVPGHAPDPAAQAFADHFTAHYAEFAAERPVIQELVELAKWVSLAKWIKESGIPLDPGWLSQAATAVDTPSVTPAITVTRSITHETTGEISVWTSLLYGGVDLTVENEYVAAEPSLGLEAWRSRPSETASSWTFPASGGAERRAVAMSLAPVEQVGARVVQVKDLAAPSPGELGPLFSRWYSSVDTRSTALGHGWSPALAGLEFPLPRQTFYSNENPNQSFSLYSEIVVRASNGRRRRYVLKGPSTDGNIYYEPTDSPGSYDLFLRPDGSYGFRTAEGLDQSFNAEGQLARIEGPGGEWRTYEIRDGQLAHIEDSSGQWIELDYDGERVAQVLDSTGQMLSYVYNERGDLSWVVDGEGRPAASYQYDDAHRLVQEWDVQRQALRLNQYDALGRLIGWEDARATYRVDLSPTGARVIRTGKGEGPVQSAAVPRPELLQAEGTRQFLQAGGPQYASDLTLVEELRTEGRLPSAESATIVYAAGKGEGMLLLVNGAYVKVTAAEMDSPEGLRERLQASGALPAEGPIVVGGRGAFLANFQALFPDRYVLYAQGLDAGMIASNLEALRTGAPLSPTKTAIFNGIPADSTQLVQLGLDAADWPGWAGIREKWEQSFQRAGYQATPAGGTAAQIEQALQEADNTLIVVAHGTSETIFFPDGSRLDPDQIGDQAREAIRRNRPLVILISCETAQVRGTESFAKKLLDMGVKGVLAPDSWVGAKSSAQFLESLLTYSQQGDGFLDAWLKAFQDLQDQIRTTPRFGDFRLLIGERATPPQAG